jgi:hypothetical protein
MSDRVDLTTRGCFMQLLSCMISVGFCTWVAVSLGITNNILHTRTGCLLLVYTVASYINSMFLIGDFSYMIKHLWEGRLWVLKEELPSAQMKVRVLFDLGALIPSCWMTGEYIGPNGMQCNVDGPACDCVLAIAWLTIVAFGISTLFVFGMVLSHWCFKPHTRPLLSQTILPRFEIQIPNNDDDVCSICLQTITIQESGRLPCTHQFHRGCILVWFLQHRSCPICRTEYPRNENNGGLAQS